MTLWHLRTKFASVDSAACFSSHLTAPPQACILLVPVASCSHATCVLGPTRFLNTSFLVSWPIRVQTYTQICDPHARESKLFASLPLIYYFPASLMSLQISFFVTAKTPLCLCTISSSPCLLLNGHPCLFPLPCPCE